MRELKTTQTMHKLNKVFAEDAPGNGGAHHTYAICRNSEDTDLADTVIARIEFQNGPRSAQTSTTGVLDVDLLEIVRDRLTSFQCGDYSCYENEMALLNIENALEFMNKRVMNRTARGVLGTDKP